MSLRIAYVRVLGLIAHGVIQNPCEVRCVERCAEKLADKIIIKTWFTLPFFCTRTVNLNNILSLFPWPPSLQTTLPTSGRCLNKNSKESTAVGWLAWPDRRCRPGLKKGIGSSANIGPVEHHPDLLGKRDCYAHRHGRHVTMFL